jgi:hypothetical protein
LRSTSPWWSCPLEACRNCAVGPCGPCGTHEVLLLVGLVPPWKFRRVRSYMYTGPFRVRSWAVSRFWTLGILQSGRPSSLCSTGTCLMASVNRQAKF